MLSLVDDESHSSLEIASMDTDDHDHQDRRADFDHGQGGEGLKNKSSAKKLKKMKHGVMNEECLYFDNIITRDASKTMTSPSKKKTSSESLVSDTEQLPVLKASSLGSIHELEKHDIERMVSTLKAGIESSDTDMVMSVLTEGRHEAVVNEVLSLLDISVSVPFLRMLKKLVSRKSVKTTLQLFWLEHLIQSKLTFLLSVDGLQQELKSIQETLNIRIEVFDRVLKMKGRLNLLMSQVSSSEKKRIDLAKKPAMIEYQDSGDSEEEQEDPLPTDDVRWKARHQLNLKDVREAEEELEGDDDGEEGILDDDFEDDDGN